MTTWDKTTPDAIDAISAGDNEIRDGKAALEEGMALEHYWPDANTFSSTAAQGRGRHRRVASDWTDFHPGMAGVALAHNFAVGGMAGGGVVLNFWIVLKDIVFMNGDELVGPIVIPLPPPIFGGCQYGAGLYVAHATNSLTVSAGTLGLAMVVDSDGLPQIIVHATGKIVAQAGIANLTDE